MAETIKVLGQSALTPETDTDVYTVPSATEAVLSTIVVCNRDSSATTFRLAVRPDGATIANQHYVAYDVALPASDSTTLTLGITMNASDVLTAYSAAGSSVTVNVFGTEITSS